MLIPMVCLFFSRNEKVTALLKLFFSSICEEIQTLFFADGSEVVRLVGFSTKNCIIHQNFIGKLEKILFNFPFAKKKKKKKHLK